MQRIRKALTIVGGATLMVVMLGVAAFAFSAAVQPGLFANPGAITVGFASTADAQPVGVGPIVTCVPSVDSAKPPAAAATGNPARSVRRVSVARASSTPRRAKKPARVSEKKHSTPGGSTAPDSDSGGSQSGGSSNGAVDQPDASSASDDASTDAVEPHDSGDEDRDSAGSASHADEDAGDHEDRGADEGTSDDED